MTDSTRSKILSIKPSKNRKVYVHDWDVDVYIKKLNISERISLQHAVRARSKKYNESKITEDIESKIVTIESLIHTAFDKKNVNIFSCDDYDALLIGSAEAVELCFKVANELNNFSNEEKTKKK